MMAKLYDTAEEFDAKETEICAELGIPTADGKTIRYAERKVIDNPASTAVGKFPFPVMFSKTWNSGPYFNGSELIPWDVDWFLSSIIPPG